MTSKELGNIGEEIAARYLSDSGFSLHRRNWRSHHREIDIVAEWYGEIVFVEVKTRTSEDFSTALSAVDAKKRHDTILAAKHFMNYYFADRPCTMRFDIITVVGGQDGEYELTHYRGAFSPESDNYIPEYEF